MEFGSFPLQTTHPLHSTPSINGMWRIPPDALKQLVDTFLLDIKREIQKAKTIERKEIEGDWGDSPAFAPIESGLRRVK